MRTLRSRLILSHILPLLIVLPLLGVTLVYILETQVLLTALSDELAQQAALTAEIAADRPDIWVDTQQAQIFVTRFSSSSQATVKLLSPAGTLLASTDAADADRVGQLLDVPALANAQPGQNTTEINYSFDLEAEIVEVLVPVPGPNQQIVGLVRLTRELSTFQDRFLSLRYLTSGVVVTALLIAVGLGLILALTLEKSLRRVTDAVYKVASGSRWQTLPEEGPQEIRLLLRAFNRLIERLRLLEEARQRLLANLVHEVSRPIGAVQSAIQALLGGAENDEPFRHELLEGMNAEVQRLRPLLDNLANLHEQVLGALELERQPTPLEPWLRQTVMTWREPAHAKGLHWQVDLPASLPEIEIDRNRLAQVLGNLLSNAVKYTPGGGTVSVTAGQNEDSVWITVGDTGPGIAEAEQERIFEPFYRSEPGKRFPQGMGLGLTIAHDLVAAHGGKLVVTSIPKRGSQFTVWLPLLQSSPQ